MPTQKIFEPSKIKLTIFTEFIEYESMYALKEVISIISSTVQAKYT